MPIHGLKAVSLANSCLLTRSVIAVPGLGSHAIGAWKSNNYDVWLRDFLPTDVPNIRVLLYGYDTTLLKSNSKKSIEDMGRIFLEDIKAFRASNGVGDLQECIYRNSLFGRPIVDQLYSSAIALGGCLSKR
jgi:hypothetical protein